MKATVPNYCCIWFLVSHISLLFNCVLDFCANLYKVCVCVCFIILLMRNVCHTWFWAVFGLHMCVLQYVAVSQCLISFNRHDDH